MFGSAGPSVVAFCAQELSGERNSFIALKEVSNLSHMFAAEELIVQVLRVEGALRFFDLAYEGEWIYAFGESEIGSVFTDRPALYGLNTTQKKKRKPSDSKPKRRSIFSKTAQADLSTTYENM